MANIDGTNSNDFLIGDIDFFGSDDDTINGLDGDDIIKPGDGIDDIDGGADTDTLDYSFGLFAGGPTEGVDLNLELGIERNDGFGNTGTISNVENVIGSRFNDLIEGDTGNNVLSGGAGDDDIFGDEGNDTLNGGAGNDDLFGDEGDDILNGGPGNDKLFSGETTVEDILNGGTGDDELFGANGTDILNGGAGDDFLSGSDDNDTLNGGLGNDTLEGGAGQDTQTGGLGDDLFVYFGIRSTNLGTDEITDFQDDGGFLGFLNTLTGEDQLEFTVPDAQPNDQLVAERNGDTLDVFLDTDGDLGTDGDRTSFVSIQFASSFIVDNIDENDLSANSDDVIFL